jgi:hypothetical protein
MGKAKLALHSHTSSINRNSFRDIAAADVVVLEHVRETLTASGSVCDDFVISIEINQCARLQCDIHDAFANLRVVLASWSTNDGAITDSSHYSGASISKSSSAWFGWKPPFSAAGLLVSA